MYARFAEEPPQELLDKLYRLHQALQKSWGPDTSSMPDEWSPKNPAWGQCAPTALVVRKHLGIPPDGSVVPLKGRGLAYHVLNRDPHGTIELDLTRGQFPPGTPVLPLAENPEWRTSIENQEEVANRLQNPVTQRQFRILDERVQRFLNKT